MKAKISSFLFKIARSKLGDFIIRWSFAHMVSFMPVNKLRETKLVVAFYHPTPSHKLHILIVPKREIRSFVDILPEDFPVVQDVVTVAQEIVKDLGLGERGYRLLVNGGSYQDVKQVHFHLISDNK